MFPYVAAVRVERKRLFPNPYTVWLYKKKLFLPSYTV